MNIDSSQGNLIATEAPPTRCDKCAVRARALFQGVPLDQLEWTQRYREKQFRVERRKSLFEENEDHPYVYTLYGGWVMLSKLALNGKRQILRFALPGDFLGFQTRLGGPMTYSAHAITSVRVCAFPRDGLQSMMKESSDLATRMAMLNARDTEFTQQMLIATNQNMQQRVTSLLVQLYIRVQALGNLVAGSDENSIEMPVSQNMLADASGLSPETVNRTLRALREKGVLELRTKRLTLLDKAQAFEISELDVAAVEQQALL